MACAVLLLPFLLTLLSIVPGSSGQVCTSGQCSPAGDAGLALLQSPAVKGGGSLKKIEADADVEETGSVSVEETRMMDTTMKTSGPVAEVPVDLKHESKTKSMHLFLSQFAQVLRKSSLSQDTPGQVDKSLQHEFQHIFESNEWGNAESRSGSGSTVASTAGVRACLDSWIAKYNVKFLLDIPCGDGNWQGMIPDIANGSVKYHGYDISPGAVARAKEHNKANTNMRFGVLDLVNQVPEEQADMVMIKEVIQHLPLAMGLKMLQHAKAAGIKWLAVTSNPAYHNVDIKPGDWFPGPNAQAPPFNFGAAAESCGKNGQTGGENDFMLFDLEAWKGA